MDQMPNITGVLPAGAARFQAPIPDYFPGQTTAGFTPRQSAAYDAMQAWGQGMGGALSDYVAGGPRMNPYMDQVSGALVDRMNQQFRRQVLPALRGSQIAVGAGGASGAGIQTAMATDDFQRTLSDQLANLLFRGFESTEDRYLKSLTQAPSALGQAAAMMRYPGEREYDLNQLRLGRGQDRYGYYLGAPDARLAQYGQAIAGQPTLSRFGDTTSTSTGTQGVSGNPNMWQGIIGGVASGLPTIFDSLGW
jgi:hypothetical protein